MTQITKKIDDTKWDELEKQCPDDITAIRCLRVSYSRGYEAGYAEGLQAARVELYDLFRALSSLQE